MGNDWEKRDIRQTKAAEASAKADRGAAEAAESQAQALAEGARRQAAAAEHAAHAQASALAREAAAREEMLQAQGQAAVAAAVGQLSSEGVAQVNAFQQEQQDRENTQKLFDLQGDCIGCIETRGAPSPKFQAKAYGGKDEVDENGQLKRYNAKLGGAYRYANLTAAIAQLVDLRNEAQRIQTWHAHESREQMMGRINTAIAQGREEQKSAAAATIRQLKEIQNGIRKGGFVGLAICVLLGAGGYYGYVAHEWEFALLGFGGLCLLLGFIFSAAAAFSPEGYSHDAEPPDAFAEMKDLLS